MMVAVLLDWAVLMKATIYVDFDYRYWPLSKVRRICVGAAVLMAVYIWVAWRVLDPLWIIGPFIVFSGLWVALTMSDIEAQRRTRAKPLPRYSESEFGSD